MRSASKTFRLQANSYKEIYEGIAQLERDFGYLRHVVGRKPKVGPILSAIVVHFLELPRARQEKILIDSFARIAELRQSDVPIKLGPGEELEETDDEVDERPDRKPEDGHAAG